MKKSMLFLTIVFASSITLTGCGASSSSGSGTGQTNLSSTNESNLASTDIKTGVTKMVSIATDLKDAIQEGNEGKVKELGPTLEDTWGTFEDSVKPKYPDQYQNVETYLDPTVAGSKTSPLDEEALSKMSDSLINALNQLAEKVQ